MNVTQLSGLQLLSFGKVSMGFKCDIYVTNIFLFAKLFKTAIGFPIKATILENKGPNIPNRNSRKLKKQPS